MRGKKRSLPQLHIVVHRGDHGLQDPEGLWVICQGILVSSGKQKHSHPVIIRRPMLIAIRFVKLAQTQEDNIWGIKRASPLERRWKSESVGDKKKQTKKTSEANLAS